MQTWLGTQIDKMSFDLCPNHLDIDVPCLIEELDPMLENFVEELQNGVFVVQLGYELWGLQNCLTQNCLNLERNLDSLKFDHFNIISMGRSIIYYNKSNTSCKEPVHEEIVPVNF